MQRAEPGTHVLLAPISTWKEFSGKGFPSRVSDLRGQTAPRCTQLITRPPAPPRFPPCLPELGAACHHCAQCRKHAVGQPGAPEAARTDGITQPSHHRALPGGCPHPSHTHFKVFRLPRAGRHLLRTPSISSSTFQPAECKRWDGRKASSRGLSHPRGWGWRGEGWHGSLLPTAVSPPRRKTPQTLRGSSFCSSTWMQCSPSLWGSAPSAAGEAVAEEPNLPFPAPQPAPAPHLLQGKAAQ